MHPCFKYEDTTDTVLSSYSWLNTKRSASSLFCESLHSLVDCAGSRKMKY